MDEIGDVLEPPEEAFEEPPENATAITRELLRGVYKMKDRLLLVFDPDRTLALEETPSPAQQFQH